MEYSIFPTKASALKWARENLIQDLNRRYHLTRSIDPDALLCREWILTYRENDLIPIMGEAELDNLLTDAGVDIAPMVARTLKKLEI